jgi:hypothetical protein
MISVTYLSRSFSSFWNQLVPWLNSFVAHANHALVEKIGKPIKSIDDPSFRSINNTIAFYKFVEAIRAKKITPDMKSAYLAASNALQFLPRNNLEHYKISRDDLGQIMNQVKLLYDTYSNSEIILHPKFPGCGIIFACEGDFIYKKTLVEVKAGDRDFTPSDFRQIILYLSLNYISQRPLKIDNIEIVNPRVGLQYLSDIVSFFDEISDKNMEEIFFEIASFSERYSISN